MALKGLGTIIMLIRFSKPVLLPSLLKKHNKDCFSSFFFLLSCPLLHHLTIYLSAEEASGGQRLEEERGGHVRDGGKEEDVRRC